MNGVNRSIVSILIACALTACGVAEKHPGPAAGPDPDPAAVKPEPPAKPEPPPDPAQLRAAQTEALLVTIEALAKVHDQHASDCPGLAEAIVQFHGEHGAALADAPAELHAMIDADEPLRARMRAAMESVMTASMACRDDPVFAAASTELFGDASTGER